MRELLACGKTVGFQPCWPHQVLLRNSDSGLLHREFVPAAGEQNFSKSGEGSCEWKSEVLSSLKQAPNFSDLSRHLKAGRIIRSALRVSLVSNKTR